jgi:hypothetical protein
MQIELEIAHAGGVGGIEGGQRVFGRGASTAPVRNDTRSGRRNEDTVTSYGDGLLNPSWIQHQPR